MYMKTSKELLDLKDEFIKVFGFKVNTEKFIEFPYSRNEQIIQILKDTFYYSMIMSNI